MPRDYAPELQDAIGRLQALLATVRQTPLEQFLYRAPIIDHAHPDGWRQLDVLGYGKTIQGFEKQLAILQAVSSEIVQMV